MTPSGSPPRGDRTRAGVVGSERDLLRTYQRLYPGFAAIARKMYADAIAALAKSRVQDLSDMFDGIAEPVFTDSVHINERGNRTAAERIAATVRLGPGDTAAAGP